MTEKVLITGFTGQDGTFLADRLLREGHEVLGMVRRVSTEPPRRIRGDFDFTEQIRSGQLQIVSGDLLAVGSLLRIMKDHRPDLVYNLAAQSHVATSFEQPELTTKVNYEGLLNLFTALDQYAPNARLYQASTSEMFGNDGKDKILDESSDFNPNSPYAISKTAAHYAVRARRAMGKFACAGILFNHESEIRGGDFVTQKIVRGAVRYRHEPAILELGNLNAQRDWGFAGDYVRAMMLINNHTEPDEFVVGTGKTRSVRQFAEAVYKEIGYDLQWQGKDDTEVGVIDGNVAIRVNPVFYRPNDVNYLRSNPDKARDVLDWQPQVSFSGLIHRMVRAEWKRRYGNGS